MSSTSKTAHAKLKFTDTPLVIDVTIEVDNAEGGNKEAARSLVDLFIESFKVVYGVKEREEIKVQ